MSEQNLNNKHPLSEPIAELLRELQQTPAEYWPNLLQMIRLFRETVTMKHTSSDAWEKAMDEINNPDPEKQVARQKALSELIRKWEEEGDEEEQTETAEILRKALEETPISI